MNVKWGKELLSGIELDKTQDVMTFKAILYALSNVPVDKQKIMIKGKMLKDSDDLSKLDIQDGMTLMMMGAAEGKALQAPTQPVKFLEDMTAAEIAKLQQDKSVVVIPAGLDNLGNTCYMNSVVQCFKRVNELRDALKQFNPTPQQQEQITRLGG